MYLNIVLEKKKEYPDTLLAQNFKTKKNLYTLDNNMQRVNYQSFVPVDDVDYHKLDDLTAICAWHWYAFVI